MELIRPDHMQTLANPGIRSTQLLNPGNSESVRVTISRVMVEPGAEQAHHAHKSSEQVWVTPFNGLIATPARGNLMGNRIIPHDDQGGS